jgi:hypothetical protein
MVKSSFNLIGTAIMGLMIGAALAQTAPAPAPSPEPTLSFSEQAGIAQVSAEFNKATADLQQLRADIEKNHPGYQLGANGKLVKVTPPTSATTTPAAPATKK